MDSELFTVGGISALPMGSSRLQDNTASNENYNWQVCRTHQVARHSLKLLWWVMLFLTIYIIVTLIPLIINTWYDMVKKVNGFTQKEGLLYQGASTNVTRDDMGWPTHDTLAEQAMKAQARVTEMGGGASAPVTAKVNFVAPRETMATKLNPEEELMKKQKAASHM